MIPYKFNKLAKDIKNIKKFIIEINSSDPQMYLLTWNIPSVRIDDITISAYQRDYFTVFFNDSYDEFDKQYDIKLFVYDITNNKTITKQDFNNGEGWNFQDITIKGDYEIINKDGKVEMWIYISSDLEITFNYTYVNFGPPI